MSQKVNGALRASKAFKSMAHPARLAIVSYLVENQDSTFTELCIATSAGNLNPATVKHHFKVLNERGIAEKNSRSCYNLTEFGKAAYGTYVQAFMLLGNHETQKKISEECSYQI